MKKAVLFLLVEIYFKKTSPNATTPTKTHAWDAGYDLYSCESASILPMERKVICIGIEIEIPTGFYGRIAPRSGLAVRAGLDTLAGVIDCGYRDEVKVVLINLNLPQVLLNNQNDKRAMSTTMLFGDKNRYDISSGDRIAQIIIERCHEATWREKESLDKHSQRNGGFGSTGI